MANDTGNTSQLGIEGVPHFHLVKCSESDVETLEKCEKQIKEFWGSKTELKWVTPKDCLELDTETIPKTHVYVFREFGVEPAFQHLRTGRRALLLGPPALMRCLKENEAIPAAPPPWIYNTAMSGLYIALSGFTPEEKKRYSDLISFMGGLCLPVFTEKGTHLVSNTVLSSKYEAAVKLKVAIMHADWIEDVWNKNLNNYVPATDEQFNACKLPIFYNLNVSCTLLAMDEKQTVERLINDNGGTFQRSYKPKDVHILLLNEKGKNSDKFRAAVKSNKTCLTPKWVLDSEKAGFALPFDDYAVQWEVGGLVSTPKKDSLEKNPEFSISHIQGSGNTTCNETLLSVRSKNLSMLMEIPEPPSTAEVLEEPRENGDYYKDCFKNMTITNAKRAGPFLDGCNIYFSGFSATELSKLNKIISLSGATRFEDINENVTHVIVGKKDDKELKAFQALDKGIHFVKFSWLKDSMDAKQPANEDDYCYEVAAATNKTVLLEQPSPASKRNIAAMNSSFKKPFPKNDQINELSQKRTTDEDDFPLSRNNLMNRYLHSSAANMEIVERTAPEKDKSQNRAISRVDRHPEKEDSRLMHTTFDSQLGTDDYEILNFFNGKLFAVQDTINAQDHMQLLTDIENFGGAIVDKSFRGQVDYLVTASIPLPNFKPIHKAKHMVTNLWIEDVITARKEIPVEYYHGVVSVTDDTVLQGHTCTISTYGGAERHYLTLIAQAIGATVEEKYEKKKFPILICQKAEGSKYKGAVNWEFPVVTKEWLLDCFQKSYLYKLEDYLVGAARLSTRHKNFIALNERGIPRGSEPPPTSNHNDSSIINIRSESPLLSQVPPSPMVHLKRKSDDGDTFAQHNDKKKFKSNNDLKLLPPNSPSPTYNTRILALRGESKAASAPGTPTTQHVREMGAEFGYDTPRRQQLYDVLKEMNNVTPCTPNTPAVMKMPPVQLHPDPDATPGRQWDVLHKFSGYLEKNDKKTKKKPKSPTTPLSEIKRRFWQHTLGEDYVNELRDNNSTIMNINTQQILVMDKEINKNTNEVANTSDANLASTSGVADPITSGVEEEAPSADGTKAMKGLMEFINKRKSEPQKTVVNMDTCPVETYPPVECPETMTNYPDGMVGWAEPNELEPIRSQPRNSLNTSREPRPFFLTSGVVVQESHIKMIEELNGEIQMKKAEYDPKCTHVLCSNLARGEKVMCALAAGKWIVRLNYIEDSHKANRFLNEEKYEWGNPSSDFDLEKLSEIERALANAAHWWRTRTRDPNSQTYQGGAFHGFKVLMWSKTAGYKRLIEAGGGKCLSVSVSYPNDGQVAKTATHCLVEKRVPLSAENLRFCKENGIPMYEVQFLNEYLLNPNSANLKSFEYKGSRNSGRKET